MWALEIGILSFFGGMAFLMLCYGIDMLLMRICTYRPEIKEFFRRKDGKQ